MKISAFVAAMVVLLGASAAWACPISGKYVCASDPTIGVGGVAVTVSGPETVTTTSCSDAAACTVGTFSTHVFTAGDYTLTPGGNVAFCGAPSYVVDFGTVLVDDPVQCPGTKTADCSPGYYKNHPETWCVQCGFGATAGSCQAMVDALSARGPGSSAVRDAVKAQIDACFGTAAASPCLDDN